MVVTALGVDPPVGAESLCRTVSPGRDSGDHTAGASALMGACGLCPVRRGVLYSVVLASRTRSLAQFVISAKLCAMSFVHSSYKWCEYMVGLSDTLTHPRCTPGCSPAPPDSLLPEEQAPPGVGMTLGCQLRSARGPCLISFVNHG